MRCLSVQSPDMHLFGRIVPAFWVFGIAGVIVGLTVTVGLALQAGLPLTSLAVLLLVPLPAAYGIGLVARALLQEERHVSYHHQIGLPLICTGLLVGLGEPVVPALDVGILGLGLTIAIARMGCLRAGCCHGRPGPFGLRYSAGHHGLLDRRLAGHVLWPVQIMEAAMLVGIVAVGLAFVTSAGRSGLAFLWYLSAYAAGRFLLETLRGDPGRPMRSGLSEAQLTSLGVIWLAAFATAAGPFNMAPAAILPAVILSAWALRIALVHRAARRGKAPPRLVDGAGSG